MTYGYVRVSTKEQNEQRQLEIMKKHGIDKRNVYSEKVSGKSIANRIQLQRLLDKVQKGDCIVIESYSRLSRNMQDLLKIVNDLGDKGVSFISDKEQVDTSTPAGKFAFHIFASLAQFERECILQRQKEGIEIAKKAGKYKGRKPVEVPPKFEKTYTQWRDGIITAVEAMRILDLKKTTFYKMVKTYEEQQTANK